MHANVQSSLCYPSFLVNAYRHELIYARKMAAKAARAVMAIELPTVLAAPLKDWIGELVGLATTLSDELVNRA